MPACFADTSFWIALSSKRDEHHARALAWSRYVSRTETQILTTEAVLWEWMNAFSDSTIRQLAAAAYHRCHRDPQIEVVPFHADLIAAAVQLYDARHDKEWSLTDCLSFIVMERWHVAQALTTDHHFRQAGYKVVLGNSPLDL